MVAAERRRGGPSAGGWGRRVAPSEDEDEDKDEDEEVLTAEEARSSPEDAGTFLPMI